VRERQYNNSPPLEYEGASGERSDPIITFPKWDYNKFLLALFIILYII